MGLPIESSHGENQLSSRESTPLKCDSKCQNQKSIRELTEPFTNQSLISMLFLLSVFAGIVANTNVHV